MAHLDSNGYVSELGNLKVPSLRFRDSFIFITVLSCNHQDTLNIGSKNIIIIHLRLPLCVLLTKNTKCVYTVYVCIYIYIKKTPLLTLGLFVAPNREKSNHTQRCLIFQTLRSLTVASPHTPNAPPGNWGLKVTEFPSKFQYKRSFNN